MKKRLLLLLISTLGVPISVPYVHAAKSQLVTIQTFHTGQGGKRRYIRAQSNGNMGLDRVNVTSEEKFTMITHSDGRVSFLSANGRLVSTSDKHDLRANATSMSNDTKFTVRRYRGGEYSFKTSRGKYWSANKYYMIANRDRATQWETFWVKVLPTPPSATRPPTRQQDQIVTLQSAHGKHVRAQSNGNMGNDSQADGPEERFLMRTHADGKVSFKSNISGKYVSAKPNGDLRADIIRIGRQEKFTAIKVGSKYAFKTVYNKYWVAQSNGPMRANRTRISQWETFRLVIHKPANLTKAQLHAAIKRYAPILFLHRTEKYRLSTPEHFIKHATTYRNNGKLSLKLRSTSARRGNWRRAKAYINAKIEQVSTDIQYWFFYNYNGPGTVYIKRLRDFRMKPFVSFEVSPCGEHEGDWEHVTVRINNRTRKITGLYLSQHDGGKWLVGAKELKKAFRGTRIRIFSSKNGHGSYLRRGMNSSQTQKFGVLEFRLANRTSLSRSRFDARGRYRIISVRKFGKNANREYRVNPPSWMKYNGRWGRVKKNSSAIVLNYLTMPIIASVTFGKLHLKKMLEDAGIWGECLEEAGSSAPWTKCNWRESETSNCQFFSASIKTRKTKPKRWSEVRWKRCTKCQSLHYAPLVRKSRCPAGGRHSTQDKQRFTLVKSQTTVKISGAQSNWRYCRKCQGLSYAPHVHNSKCPAGGRHLTRSGNYQLFHGKKPQGLPLPTQGKWRWCKKCQSLHYGPNRLQSRCPAGGQHSVQRSGHYHLYVHGTSSTPTTSTKAKCWVRLPTGCSNRRAEQTVKGITSRKWVHDIHGDSKKSFCEGSVFRRNVNKFCKKTDTQTFWGSRPTKAKCWVRLPTGCNNRRAEQTVKGITSRKWVHDIHGDSKKSFCEGPVFRRNVNKFCKKTDTQTFWGVR